MKGQAGGETKSDSDLDTVQQRNRKEEKDKEHIKEDSTSVSFTSGSRNCTICLSSGAGRSSGGRR